MTREEVLDYSKASVTGKRVQDHGEMENNFKTISRFWTIYTGKSFSERDVAVMMALLKIARIKTGHDEKDSFIDACGYMACAGELEYKNENAGKN